MKNYIGIDLGTTNSAVCAYDGENLRLFKSPDQNDVTPSAMFIDKRGNKYVGKRAYDNAARNPENAATLFKRLMGTSTPVKLPAVNLTMTPEECASRGLPAGSQWFPIEGVHAPRVPKLWDPRRGGRGWSFWQYGGDGYRCAGVPGWCDRSVFNGDEEALRAVSGLGPRLSQVVEDFAKGIARGALTSDLVDAAVEAYQRDKDEG